MSKFIVVEANIGVGKSTMLPRLVKKLNKRDGAGKEWVELQEPVDDPKFNKLLTKFYDNPTPDNRIKFQMYITNRRYEMCKDLPKDKNYVLERSLLSDLVFSQANFLSMEQPDASYMSYYYDIKDKLSDYPKLDMCVYLHLDPITAYQRMRARGRDAEKELSYSYMTDIHKFHEACLPQICREYKIPMGTYDWSVGSDIDIECIVSDVMYQLYGVDDE